MTETKTDLSASISHNLKRYSRNHGSIAELCRSVDINRQQFAKYMSGDHLPSLMTLARLADALGVTIGDLTRCPDAPNSPPESLQIGELCMSTVTDRAVALAGGYYFELTQADAEPGRVLVCLSRITRMGTVWEYRRKMPIQTTNRPRRFWNHYGYIFNSLYSATVLYVNLKKGNQVSTSNTHLSTFQVNNASIYNHDLIGIKSAIMSSTPTKPFAAPIYMHYIGSKPDLRQCLDKCGSLNTKELARAGLAEYVEIMNSKYLIDNGVLTIPALA
ncbi:MAG: helix-turn-helix domain-containing protein [Hyphomicrobiaceae bacterium]